MMRARSRSVDGFKRWWDDHSGATAVQAIAFLPLIVFFLVAGIKLWETINIRKSLHHGTYLAVRYLSLYPPESGAPQSVWEDIVREYVEAELKSSPFTALQYLQRDLDIQVDLSAFNDDCGDPFTVDVDYRLTVPVGGGSPLPDLAPIQLEESIEGVMLCED